MRLQRYLNESCVLLRLTTWPNYPGVTDVEDEELERVREGVINEFADVFDSSGSVSNRKKLADDLLARERRTSTAIGGGIAFPHVRTRQARGFALAVARSEPGLPFAAVDDKLVHLFVAMIAPPHDDKLFLRVESTLARAFTESQDFYNAIMEAQEPGEIVRALASLR